VAPLHRGRKQSASSLKRTASSPAHSGGSGDISAAAAAAAADRAGDSETGDAGGSRDHARRLQELAAVLSGTLPMGPEDNLLLEELLKVGS
jgi:predicted lipid-binding transport protein (Tim44 family)